MIDYIALLTYWAVIYGGVFLAVLMAFTILDWILDR